MKYELTDEFKIVHKKKLYRIRALKSFQGWNNVKIGDLGGFVESEKNLSQDGGCWICEDAMVLGNAIVFDEACLYGRVLIEHYSQIFGDAKVYGDAYVGSHAKVYGFSEVYGNSFIYDNAKVYDKAQVFGNSFIGCEAEICGSARIYGDAEIVGKAIIGEFSIISTGHISKYSSIVDKLKGQCFVTPINGKIILYKRVNKIKDGIYRSLFDPTFIYEENKIQEVKNPEMSNNSCESGIHLSYPTYWTTGNTLIACEVKIEDIITVQQGKIRCSKCKVIGEVK